MKQASFTGSWRVASRSHRQEFFQKVQIMAKLKKNDLLNFCLVRTLPQEKSIESAAKACEINPANRPPNEGMLGLAAMTGVGGSVEPDHLALLTSRYWQTGGVRLTVGFLESPPLELKKRILSYMNLWGEFCNAGFVLTDTDPQVRITLDGQGYWSYLGTDILGIPKNQPTMCLSGFTTKTSDTECMRVIPHETGHTMGFAHEHMRREIVARIDPVKALNFFKAYQGWSAQTVVSQVLTPLEDSQIKASPSADETSIMCYRLPGSITRDGKPILGGDRISAIDRETAAKIYPPVIIPPPTDGKIIVPEGSTLVIPPGTYYLRQ